MSKNILLGSEGSRMKVFFKSFPALSSLRYCILCLRGCSKKEMQKPSLGIKLQGAVIIPHFPNLSQPKLQERCLHLAQHN